jgi:hypothetical protein
MITLFFGKLRSGKTTLQTALGHDDYLDGKKIYSNYKVEFAEMIDPYTLLDENIKLNNCTLLLDEIYTLLESQRQQNRGTRLASYFIFQSGKKDVDIMGTAQLLNSVSYRAVDLSDIQVHARKVVDPSIKDVNNPRQIREFVYTVFEDFRYSYKFRLKFDDLYPIMKMFNTLEVVYPTEMVGHHGVTIESIIELYKDMPTKKSFVAMLRVKTPFISIETCGALFDLIKINRISEAKKLL